MSDEVKNEKPKRKYGKAGTLFDIKEFKKNLDTCNFSKVAFGLDKKGKDYYIVTIVFDPVEKVGNVLKSTKVSNNLDYTLNILEETNRREQFGLPHNVRTKEYLP